MNEAVTVLNDTVIPIINNDILPVSRERNGVA